MSTKKLTLNMADMESDFFSDTSLIGLACSQPAHKICWTLNRHFDMRFCRKPDLDVRVKKSKDEEEQYFSIYEYLQPLNGTRHLLYKLKNSEDVLLPEVKQLDYLWMIQSEDAEQEAMILSHQLRDLPGIQLAQIIDPDRLKRLNYLLI